MPDGVVLANGETTNQAGFRWAIAAYDIKPGEPSHQKAKRTHVITVGDKRIIWPE